MSFYTILLIGIEIPLVYGEGCYYKSQQISCMASSIIHQVSKSAIFTETLK